MKLFYQSLLICSAFIFILFWNVFKLDNLTVPAIGLLTVCYLLLSISARKDTGLKPAKKEFDAESVAIFFLTSTILLLISLTGGFNSYVFFLLYFLLFWVAFVLLPQTVFVLVVATAIFFAPDVLSTASIESYLKLFSLVILSPIAYYFGLEFRKRALAEESIERLREQSHTAADHIVGDVVSIMQDEKKQLKLNSLEKLDDVIRQADALRQNTK